MDFDGLGLYFHFGWCNYLWPEMVLLNGVSGVKVWRPTNIWTPITEIGCKGESVTMER